MFCFIQSQQKMTPGEPAGYRNCQQRVVVPAAAFSWPSYMTELSQPLFHSLWCPKYLAKTKQSSKDLPAISTILTKGKAHFECWPPLPLHFLSCSPRRVVTSEGSHPASQGCCNLSYMLRTIILEGLLIADKAILYS